MKTVYLLRHAKSDWGSPGLTDFDRPLNKRGKNDAPLMGSKMNELNIAPDLIMASPARRTSDTTKVICNKIGYAFSKVQFDESIYLSSLENLIAILNAVENKYDNLLLVGHNPGITLLNNYLTDDYIDNIPTCGCVKIDLEIDQWCEITKGIGTKKYFIYPKRYY